MSIKSIILLLLFCISLNCNSQTKNFSVRNVTLGQTIEEVWKEELNTNTSRPFKTVRDAIEDFCQNVDRKLDGHKLQSCYFHPYYYMGDEVSFEMLFYDGVLIAITVDGRNKFYTRPTEEYVNVLVEGITKKFNETPKISEKIGVVDDNLKDEIKEYKNKCIRVLSSTQPRTEQAFNRVREICTKSIEGLYESTDLTQFTELQKQKDYLFKLKKMYEKRSGCINCKYKFYTVEWGNPNSPNYAKLQYSVSVLTSNYNFIDLVVQNGEVVEKIKNYSKSLIDRANKIK
jgi:hypothetical protein